MRPTRLRDLALIALFASGFGWAIVKLVERFAGRFPPVSWLTPATLALIALTLLYWTIGIRRRLARLPGSKPLPPEVAARTAALALAASRTGALMCGGYAGAAAAFAVRLDLPAARARAINSGLSVIASLVVVGVALWLERACRLPDEPDVATDPSA